MTTSTPDEVKTTGAVDAASETTDAASVRPQNRRLQVVGNVLTVFGIMMLTFVLTVTVIGAFQFGRDQKTMYADFRFALNQATAPVSQVTADNTFVPLGTPISLLTFPKQNKQFVVVEGTTSDVLMKGPGHRRDTVLPGQAGLSVIFGRRAAFGGPFKVLTEMKVGDTFFATTGQGRAKYKVTDIRQAGAKVKPTNAAGRLTLETADGKAYRPTGVLYVDADLQTAAQPAGPQFISYANLLPSERAMQGEPSNWVAVLLLSQALLLVVVGIVWLYFRQGRLVAWIIGLPVILAIGVALSNQIAGLLPNML